MRLLVNSENCSLTQDNVKDVLFHSLKVLYLLEREYIKKFGLTFQEIYLLQLLKRKSYLTISDISRELKIELFTVSRIVTHLSTLTLVIRQKDLKDKRSINVKLTEKGSLQLSQIEEFNYESISDRVKGFSKAEIDSFIFTASNIHKILRT